MVGGGSGAFIGEVHRMAARLDGYIDLVCYEMFQQEAQLPVGERMDFVSIVTPNHLHFEPAKLALQSGFHVVCDKPVAFNLAEAKELKKIINRKKLLFALTHNYTGYPMVKEAKAIVASGKLGKIRRCIVEYPQGWLATRLEATGQQQASWRTDPNKSGKAGAMGDIGTHAENLLEYITGLQITHVCADLNTFVEGRQLDDDGAILLKLQNEAKATLLATQIAAGEENNLRIRVYGEKGGLDWSHQNPNSLLFRTLNKPLQVLRTGVGKQAKTTQAAIRIPAGHPEGFLEAFANIYKNFATTLSKHLEGKKVSALHLDFPTIDDGIRGMRFIDKVVESAASSKKWIKF